MSVSVNLPDELAGRLAEEASRREMTLDELAAELIAERIPGRGHRLSFAAIGASTSGRRAAEDEAMLAERFGRGVSSSTRTCSPRMPTLAIPITSGVCDCWTRRPRI